MPSIKEALSYIFRQRPGVKAEVLLMNPYDE